MFVKRVKFTTFLPHVEEYFCWRLWVTSFSLLALNLPQQNGGHLFNEIPNLLFWFALQCIVSRQRNNFRKKFIIIVVVCFKAYLDVVCFSVLLEASTHTHKNNINIWFYIKVKCSSFFAILSWFKISFCFFFFAF